MSGKLDVILVKSVSRFARNCLEAQTYVHQLKEKNVEVIFEKEGVSSFNPQADMVFNFMAAIAQEESRSISENVRWTYRKLAEQGIRHLGNPIEIKKSVKPENKMISAFEVLDKGSVPRGKGAILCMRPELSAIDSENYIVPIWMI